MNKVFLRTPYNYDRRVASLESGLNANVGSMTVKSEKDEADINVLVRRFGLTGVMPANPRVPMSGDFTGISDYRSALEMIRAADAAFLEFTPQVRARFDNDPQKLMDFCADVNNLKEARELGLVPKEAAAPAPIKVEVINPPTAPPT